MFFLYFLQQKLNVSRKVGKPVLDLSSLHLGFTLHFLWSESYESIYFCVTKLP